VSVIKGELIPALPTGYTIDQSLRFNDNDSAYLSRTPASAGDRKTWTWSGWVKRGATNTTGQQALFSAGTSTNFTMFYLNKSTATRPDTILFYDLQSGTDYGFERSIRLRDPANWYHLMIAFDSTEATAADRVKVWVNGVLHTDTEVDYGSLPSDHQAIVNTSSNAHYLGRYANNAQYLDGYLAEVNFIDGQALTPSSFGETDEDYGHWKPKKYTGTYGTNGFYLDFADSADLGNDVSGEGNDWTPTNLAPTDVVLDSPTNVFATLNPLDDSNSTLSEGNLKTVGWYNYTGARATMAFPSSGKWYAEYAEFSTRRSNVIGSLKVVGGDTNLDNNGGTEGLYWGSSGLIVAGSGWFTGSPVDGIGSGDVLQMAYDSDTGKVWLGVNNQWLRNNGGTLATDGNPAGGSNQTYTWGSSTEDTFFSIWNYLLTGVANFGQDSSFAGNKTAQSNTDDNGYGDFYYSPPTGYLALCTQNLDDPAVIPSEHFNTVLYTGNQTVRDITGVGFQSDFIMTKTRSHSSQPCQWDSVRGANKLLSSDRTDAESAGSGMLNSFNSDGFTLGIDSVVNYTNYTYVAWCWKANGSGSSNTDGDITSTVSANQDAGFSIVSYTGNGVLSSIGHGLLQTPELLIVRKRNGYSEWLVYSIQVLGDGEKYLQLNTTHGVIDVNYEFISYNSSTFTPTGSSYTNQADAQHIAYCFHSVDGYSKVGSYTGNEPTGGTFVYTGFRPAYVMVKRTNAAGNDWIIHDSSRDTYNVADAYLAANEANAEGNYTPLDIMSNGFKPRTTHPGINASGSTYIYIAFAETPFKYSNAR